MNERIRKQRQHWKFLRMSKNITLEEVAKHVGCSISLINKWENGHLNMKHDKLELYKNYITSKKA